MAVPSLGADPIFADLTFADPMAVPLFGADLTAVSSCAAAHGDEGCRHPQSGICRRAGLKTGSASGSQVRSRNQT